MWGDINRRPLFALGALADVLTPAVVDAHLARQSPSQLRALYGAYLPANTEATREEIGRVVRSGFYQQAEARLSEQLREGAGTGYLLAQAVGYDYEGEGIEQFLNGVRNAGRREEGEQ